MLQKTVCTTHFTPGSDLHFPHVQIITERNLLQNCCEIDKQHRKRDKNADTVGPGEEKETVASTTADRQPR
jgi:hypothetical protein